jgi:hypothetical protein
MVKNGTLKAIAFNGRVRVLPESIHELEAGLLAVRPHRRRTGEQFPAEVLRALE